MRRSSAMASETTLNVRRLLRPDLIDMEPYPSSPTMAQIAEEVGPGTELATFLMFEQLAGYSRGLANEDWRFRGTERARKNCSEGSRLTISAVPLMPSETCPPRIADSDSPPPENAT